MKTEQIQSSRLFVTACVIAFVCFIGSYMRIPIVPLFATSLGTDTVQVGIINGAFMMMAGLLSIPAGLASDRWGRRLPMLGGIFLLASSSFLLYWSTSPLQMAGIYLLFGVGLSAFSPTLISYVADITPPEVLGQAYGWYTMAVYSGMTFGPAVGGFLGTALGLRQVFLVSGGLIFAMFWVALFFISPPATSHHQAAHSHPPFNEMVKSLLGNQQLVACLVATAGGCVGFGMFVTFMPLYIRSEGLSTGAVGFVFASQALANALSRLPTGKLCDRIKDRSHLVIGGMAIFAVTMGLFGLCTSVVMLMITAAFMGLSMGTAFTVVCALIVDSVPREMRGLAMGSYNTCVYAGMMLCSCCMGTIISSAGFKVAFFLAGAIVLLALVLFKFLFHRPIYWPADSNTVSSANELLEN